MHERIETRLKEAAAGRREWWGRRRAAAQKHWNIDSDPNGVWRFRDELVALRDAAARVSRVEPLLDPSLPELIDLRLARLRREITDLLPEPPDLLSEPDTPPSPKGGRRENPGWFMAEAAIAVCALIRARGYSQLAADKEVRFSLQTVGYPWAARLGPRSILNWMRTKDAIFGDALKGVKAQHITTPRKKS
jgi:hypothetical protein